MNAAESPAGPAARASSLPEETDKEREEGWPCGASALFSPTAPPPPPVPCPHLTPPPPRPFSTTYYRHRHPYCPIACIPRGESRAWREKKRETCGLCFKTPPAKKLSLLLGSGTTFCRPLRFPHLRRREAPFRKTSPPSLVPPNPLFFRYSEVMHTQKNEKKINMERERESFGKTREREIGNKLGFFHFPLVFLFVNGRAVSPPPHFFVSRQDGEGGGRQSLDREKKRVYLNEREAIKNVRRRLLRCFASLLFLKRKKERTRFFFLDSPSSSPFLIARVPPFFSPMVSMSSLLR